MANVLNKVIAGRFYQVNAGFFLLLFLLLFGITSGHDTIMLHYGIMQAIMGSYGFLGAAMAVWGLYNFKCISFFLKETNRPENAFLFNLQALSGKEQLYLLLQCQFALYFPVLLYGGVTAFTGFKSLQIARACIFILYQLLMCAIGAAVYFYRLNNTWRKPAFSLPSFHIFRKKSASFYLIHFSLYNRKGTFVAIKLFSLLLLQAMVAVNSNKVSKEAICVLVMFLISAHALLPFYYVGFMEKELAFFRNTSLPAMRRFSVYVITYSIIFIPELLFLLWNERSVLALQVILSLYALAVSQLSLYTSLLYFKNLTTDRYTTSIFAIFFITLLLLASLSLWYVAGAESILSVVLFVRLYWRYEYKN
jgi:hypothetical protein